MDKTLDTPASARLLPRPAPHAPEGPSANPSEPHLTGVQMRMILDVSRMLAVPTDLDRLLCQIAEISTGMLGCERASIFLHDPTTSELWTKVALKSGEIRVPCHKGIVGHSFTQNEVVHVPDPYSDPRFNRDPDLKSGFVTRNLLSAPMKGLDGKALGVIQCVNKVDSHFTGDDLSLIHLLADQAGVAVQRHRLQLEAVETAALRHEMGLARRVQEKLIPRSAPPIPGLEAVGWTLPASDTGGDCFDFWKLPDGRMGVLLADASGHGLAPAMIVSQARTLIRAISESEPDPHQVLVRVNLRLVDDLEWGQFVTAFLGFLSPDGTLHWTSAGHGPVFIRPCGGELIALDPPVQPLGIIPDWTDGPPPPVSIDPGGSLLLVSDGIFEALNPAGEMFSIERMMQTLDAGRDCRPKDILGALRDAVRAWENKQEPLDDQTIVVVRRDAGCVLVP